MPLLTELGRTPRRNYKYAAPTALQSSRDFLEWHLAETLGKSESCGFARSASLIAKTILKNVGIVHHANLEVLLASNGL